METQQKSETYKQMRALWFARTLHDNKIRIQTGKPKMIEKDYDEAWIKVQNDFLKRKNVSV